MRPSWQSRRAEKENFRVFFSLKIKKDFIRTGFLLLILIGFAMREEDDDGNISTVGKMGLESTYDEELTGTDGKVNFQSDEWGFILPKSEKAVIPAQDGYDIQLTIDKTIQNFVEDAMNRVEREYSPEKILVSCGEPKNRRNTCHEPTSRIPSINA